MFSNTQLADAHAKVKSGADYPGYVRELKRLGVLRYDFIVATGTNIFYGEGGYRLETDPKYTALTVARAASAAELQQILRVHQAGETDSLTFFRQAAEAGVDRWTCDLGRMEVIYTDGDGRVLLREAVPNS
jgi:uncharacterized protein YbcV (DUF1398 family)